MVFAIANTIQNEDKVPDSCPVFSFYPHCCGFFSFYQEKSICYSHNSF